MYALIAVFFVTAIGDGKPCSPIDVGWQENIIVQDYAAPVISLLDTGTSLSVLRGDYEVYHQEETGLQILKVSAEINGEEFLMAGPLTRYYNVAPFRGETKRLPATTITIELGGKLLAEEFVISNDSNMPYDVVLGRRILSNACARIDPNEHFKTDR